MTIKDWQTLPDLRPDQREIATDPARFKVVACGRRWGKTTLGLQVVVDAVLRGEQVWWVAPTYGLSFYLWQQVKRVLLPHDGKKLEQSRYIELPNDGSVMVKTAQNPDFLRGVGLDLVVIDEAAFISSEVWEAVLLPALADRKGKALIISTPRARNWFFHAYQRGLDEEIADWSSWRAPTEDNPIIGDEEVETVRALLPDHIFRQEYLAEFLPDGGEVFRNIQQVADAPTDATPDPSRRYVMGVDFGRSHDFTVLAVLDTESKTLVALDRFSEINWMLQRERIKVLAERWGVVGILAEANAIGEPNIEMLEREGLPVTGFTTTAQSKPPLIESLVVAIENELIRLIPDPVLIGELESYTYTQLPSGRYQYNAPSGRHDDTVIALALAWRMASLPPETFSLVVAVV